MAHPTIEEYTQEARQTAAYFTLSAFRHGTFRVEMWDDIRAKAELIYASGFTGSILVYAISKHDRGTHVAVIHPAGMRRVIHKSTNSVQLYMDDQIW